MPAAEDAFAGIGGHFTRETLCTLMAERRIEIAHALLTGAAEPVLTSDGLLDAIRGGKIPSKRVRFHIGRRKIDLEKLRVARDDPVPAPLLDQLLGQGATLVCNHLDRTFEPLHKLAALIADELAVRVQITAVLSVTGRSGLEPHHDLADVFIVHLEGEKEWAMLGAPVREGLPPDAFSGEEGPVRTMVLHEGDVMFLPVGQRHYCNPSSAGSLHLGILLYGANGADAGAALADAIAADPDLLRPYLAFAHKAELPVLAERYRARLHALVDELDLEAILEDPDRRRQPLPDVLFGQGGEGEMNTDPRVDARIAEASEFARPILTHLRTLVHRTVPGVEEAIKWGLPHFIYKGKNIAAMAAFKAHCSFSIHGESHEGEGMGTLGKITSLADVPSEAELVARLQAATGRIDRGETEAWRQAPPKPRRKIEVPEDFSVALAATPAAAQFFDALAPSHRHEYLEWITEAKRPETRAKRIGEALAWLAEGKRRNWKYER